jgi:hypothetical protein
MTELRGRMSGKLFLLLREVPILSTGPEPGPLSLSLSLSLSLIQVLVAFLCPCRKMVEFYLKSGCTSLDTLSSSCFTNRIFQHYII